MKFLFFFLFFGISLSFAKNLESEFTRIQRQLEKAPTKEEKFIVIQRAEDLIYARIPEIAKELGKSEEVREFILDPEISYRQFFKIWKDDYEDENFRRLLKSVSKGSTPNETEAALLKKWRKHANTLRNAHRILSAENLPKKFNKFVATFGKLNDLVAIQHHKMSEVADDLLTQMDEEDLVKKMKNIEATDLTQFKHKIRSISEDITALTKKELISVEEYHEIRKGLKYYLFLFSNLASVNGSKESFVRLVEHLEELNETLGRLNDFYTGIEHHKLIKLKKHTLELHQNTKKALLHILDQSNQAACHIHFKKLGHASHEAQ